MAGTMVDIPGRIRFFSGHGPAPVLGICPHRLCAHRSLTVIAWGPDRAHYELVRCDDRDGCAGRCRGWHDVPEGARHGRFRGWRHVGEQTPLPDDARTIDLRAGA